jgi:hypothetical protein
MAIQLCWTFLSGGGAAVVLAQRVCLLTVGQLCLLTDWQLYSSSKILGCMLACCTVTVSPG